MNKNRRKCQLLRFFIAASVACIPIGTVAEDIDIFVGTAGNLGSQGIPNVLIVLDNSSNFSANNQGWKDSSGNKYTQGQAEARSIKTALSSITNVNVGLMLMIDNGSGGGSSGTNGGSYVNAALKSLEQARATGNNKDALFDRLEAIDGDITNPGWKTSSSLAYGPSFLDAFKFFGGYTSPLHAADGVAGAPTDSSHFGTLAYMSGKTPVGALPSPASAFPYLDPLAYTNAITTSTSSITNLNFRPPLTTTGEDCGTNNYIIFVGNKFPNADNTGLLDGVNDGAHTPRIPWPNVTLQTPRGSIQQYLPDPLGGSSVTNSSAYAPEWARFLRKTDVSSIAGQQNIVTYTINAFHDKPDQSQAQLLMATATAGGGKYFAASSEAELSFAFSSILAEIQAKSSTFASASLPISATNRSQNNNQVYIGMFRPDKDAKPRWFGNMKRYQLARFGNNIGLADSTGLSAVNSNTGFVTDCASSYWTTDTGSYWSNVGISPVPIGGCTTSPNNVYSDAPDGPWVEKGAAAEMLRNRTAARVIKTSDPGTSTALKDFATTNTQLTTAGLTSADIDFIRGQDTNDENQNTNFTEVRPSIHGDVVHSRPLPVNYGATIGGTVIYYGSNDGMFRAIDADTGTETWSYVAPEFYGTLSRLRTQSPLISYPGVTDSVPPQPKNYHFDGSIGLYQTADNSKIWIFPTMRRGGRMIYALDVSPTVASATASPPTLPTIKWKIGCPSLSSDTGCTSGMSNIGQTWSVPVVAKVNVDGTVKPVVIVGGGYDSCEDVNGSSPACSTSGLVASVAAKGNRVYVLDAADGSILRSFTTSGRVASDVSVIDLDFDGLVDYAYVGDTKGNVYRISFGPSKTAPLASATWSAVNIASTTGSGRKFLYPPALVSYFDKATGKTYVYLALGSGDREKPLETQYPYTEDIKNRFYVYLDDLSLDTSTLTASNLDDPATLADLSTDPGCSIGVVPDSGSPLAGKKGWFMQYSNATGNDGHQGEQTVTSAVIVGGLVAFSTNRPIHSTGSSCSPLGEANGYFVNLFNGSGTIGPPNNLTCGGSRSDVFVGGGLPPSPVLGTVVINGRPTTVVIGAADKGGGPSSIVGGQEGFTLPPQKRTRVYWKQDMDN